MSAPNHAFILCGGLGTRLRPATNHTPKVLLKIQGKTLLEHNIDLMKRFGVENILLAVGFLKEKVKEYFGDGSGFGVKITYIEESEPLGTAGPLRLTESLGKLPKETFVMCNGDELKDIHLDRMYEFHKKNRALATIALTKVDDVSHFGVVELEGQKIIRFVEKPKPEEAPSNLINSGLYILEPEIINLVPRGQASMEREVFPKIAAQKRLFGFPFSGQWFPTDTPERMQKAEGEWKEPKQA